MDELPASSGCVMQLSLEQKTVVLFAFSGAIAALGLSALVWFVDPLELSPLKVAALIVVITSSWLCFDNGRDTGLNDRTLNDERGFYQLLPFILGFTASMLVFAYAFCLAKLILLWFSTIGLFLYGYYLGRTGFDFWSVKITRKI